MRDKEKDFLFRGALFVCGLFLTFYGITTLLELLG